MTMKALPLVLVLLAQDLSAQKAWPDRGALVADSRVVVGTPELQPDLARRTALDQAVDEVRDATRQHALEVAAQRVPSWMPDVVTDRVVGRWLARQDFRSAIEVLEQDQKVRDHGFGQSYQASLLVRPNAKKLRDSETALCFELDRAAKRFRQGIGMTLGGWVGLAFLVSWLDRLSRGYMTRRLWTLAFLVGVVAPVGLFLV